ncbi:MAG: diadenylate cyclase CdaA [Acutalibacteraceae bacterium]|nr:diadenylate cyclase CdaA [Clostridia bacterium]MEE1126958.1 diadenylate cyclase CdaA [Acutalibacteraceae bacterium]
MSGIFKVIQSWFTQFMLVMKSSDIIDLLDIIIVAFIIYKLVQIVRQTRAKQIIYGVLIIVGAWAVSSWLDMIALHSMLNIVIGQGVIALAVIFQPEIRSALELVSRTNISLLGKKAKSADFTAIESSIEAVSRACQSFQSTRTGAIIVFEHKTRLGDIIKTGTVIDADTTTELLGNVFYPKTPLHDGAAIIRDGRLYAAGCILPLTQNNNLKKELGTRHRAAIGMSENSDAVVVVVSEETGIISVAMNGKLQRDFNVVTLRELLSRELLSDFADDDDRSIIGRIKTIGGNKNDSNK